MVDDATPNTTKSYNALAIFQLTGDIALHLSLSTIDDADVYDGFVGGGFFVDYLIGSQLRFYGEGAATWSAPAGGGPSVVAGALILGVRYDFGNVWY
jgi:hypothetical protein